MLLVACSNEKGACYIETKNLDGETNKKIKRVTKDMMNFCFEIGNVRNSLLFILFYCIFLRL